MIALIQRVKTGRVDVNGQTIGSIDRGLVALIGVSRGDTEQQAKRLVQRLLNYRVFSDEQGRMNLSVVDVSGGLLLVPQFTLAADTSKGNRPGFSTAAEPAIGQTLFEYAVDEARGVLPDVQTGQFGADMQVALINDGPVTFWLEVKAPTTT